ncbi:hypothetical protein BH10PSE2_BH10PSE2_10350 [soil metagenome]
MLRRKGGMSADAFRHHWRNTHGPLAASFQHTLGIRRYTQSLRDVESTGDDGGALAREARGGMAEPFDGVAEFWFESESAIAAALSSEQGLGAIEALIADEAQFIDLPRSPFWLSHEHPQVSTQHLQPIARPRTPIVKLYFPIQQLPALSVADAQRYWLLEHGPLVRSHAAARGMICYQQVHRFETEVLDRLQERRGALDHGFIGHAEAWFDRSVPRLGPEVEDASLRALEDERNFIHWAKSTAWLSKEAVFVDRSWL